MAISDLIVFLEAALDLAELCYQRETGGKVKDEEIAEAIENYDYWRTCCYDD